MDLASVPELARLGAEELLDGYRRGAFTPVEALDAVVTQIEASEELNAFTTLCLERARDEAQGCEKSYDGGTEARPLAGLPLAVKDLYDTADVRTTYGSSMFADHVPAADAAAVRRVRDAGAVVVGKTSTHEFAWGITSDNPHFGPCRNPFDPERVPGGSSGGSAVALAVHAAPLALGSDTGGSIRIPAALCGMVGFKPTYGLVEMEGLFPLSPSLDHAGPMARSVEDAALLLGALADIPVGGRQPAASVGVCEDLMLVELSPGVRRAFEAAASAAAEVGLEVREVAFPEAGLIRRAFDRIQAAEALAVHRGAGLYPDRAAEYGEDVLAKVQSAERVTQERYMEATATRLRLSAAFARLFAEVDLLLTPVHAGPPVLIGHDEGFRDAVLPFTVPQDMAGLPACALPAGLDAGGLPIGVQLSGPQGADARVLEAAGRLAGPLVG